MVEGVRGATQFFREHNECGGGCGKVRSGSGRALQRVTVNGKKGGHKSKKEVTEEEREQQRTYECKECQKEQLQELNEESA